MLMELSAVATLRQPVLLFSLWPCTSAFHQLFIDCCHKNVDTAVRHTRPARAVVLPRRD